MAKQIIMAQALIEDDDNLALVLNRWPIGDVWSLPGGRLEPGESLTDCVVREALEEAGLLVAPVELACVIDAHNQIHDQHFLVHVFSCRVVTGTIRARPDDEYVVDAMWVKRDEFARYVTWPIYRDPVLAFLAGHDKKYWLDRDAYRPDEGKGPKQAD